MRQCAGFEMPRRDFLLTAVYRCVYTVYVGYIHYSRSRRARDAGAARAETRTAHRRTFDDRPKDERCRGLRYAVCERGTLDIIIANGSSEPIYEQITRQIKAAIMAGELAEGDPLPSIRALANDLRISVITTKRAYDELEQEGFLYAVPAKGFFVAAKNTELLREENLKKIEAHLTEAVRLAAPCGLTKQELTEMLELLWEE